MKRTGTRSRKCEKEKIELSVKIGRKEMQRNRNESKANRPEMGKKGKGKRQSDFLPANFQACTPYYPSDYYQGTPVPCVGPDPDPRSEVKSPWIPFPTRSSISGDRVTFDYPRPGEKGKTNSKGSERASTDRCTQMRGRMSFKPI